MSYTKKQRNEIYRKALKHLPNVFNNGSGICHSIRLGGGDNNAYFEDTRREYLPEFALFEPDGPYWSWFDNLQERQIVLDFCILMTEN